MPEINDTDKNSSASPDGFSVSLQVVQTIPCETIVVTFAEFRRKGKLLDKLYKGIKCPVHKGGSKTDAKT